MRTFLADFRYGLRNLARNRGFALIAIATLALGIGATVAIFGVVDAVLLKPLPYPEPERLARVGAFHPVKNSDGLGASYMDFLDMHERTRAFENLAGVLESSTVLGGSDRAAQVRAVFVSASLFPTLGLAPIAGRLFTAAEDREGGNSHVALLSATAWRQRFGGERSVLGQKILIDAVPYDVVGVIPDDEMMLDRADVTLPLVNQAFPSRSGRAVDLVGRLRPGATLGEARAEMLSIGQALEREHPEENGGFSIVVWPLAESLLGGRMPALRLLSCGVALLLLIACANTGNLLLARGASRRRELAVRVALGAGRRRLAGQLLAEGCALALLGGAGGLAVASGLLEGIRRLAAGSMPRMETIELDIRAVLFAVAATGATVLLFALLPAWSASRQAVAAGLQRASRGGGGETAGPLHGMILLQTALCVVLLVAAGLLGGSYLRLSRIDPGFSAQNVLSFTVSLPRGAYRQPPVRTAFLERLIERVRVLPGVRAAGLVGWLPGKGSMTVSFSAEGHPRLSRARSPQGEIRGVSEGTFEALRIPIFEGRGITANDRADSPGVIVVSRQLASRLWPGHSALGRHVMIFADKIEREVVGVVGDVRRLDRAGVTPDQMWVPASQDPIWIRTSAVVRSDEDPTALIASIEGAVRRLDPGVALSDVQTMGQVLSGTVAEPRFRTILISFFATAALALASIGLYGVIAYTVARRRYEIGVRIALGATPREILSLFVGRGIKLAGMGAAAGLVFALATTRLLAGLLYGVRPSDPLTFAGATALLLGVAFLASFLPARRAAKTDPLTALRSD